MSGLILAAGRGTRFGGPLPKQFCTLGSYPVLVHSIRAMVALDPLVIVCNSGDFGLVCDLTQPYNVHIVVSDGDDRNETIWAGLSYLQSFCTNGKVIIHDAARPFINAGHIDRLLSCTAPYSQYCLALTNGLHRKGHPEPVSREEYVELCTPLCVDYTLALDIYRTYIRTHQAYEILHILERWGTSYDLLLGQFWDLRKITYQRDL